MKITKQKLESLILEEIKSLQEGSLFENKVKEAQDEWLASRPWAASVLASFPKTNSSDNDVPNTLLRFISSSGAAVVHEKYRSEWQDRGHRSYDVNFIKEGGLQGSRGPLILKIIEDAFSFPLQPYVDGEGRETPRYNALENNPLVSRPQFAKDPDGKRYITFTTESGSEEPQSWVVIDTPPKSNPNVGGIAIGPAPAGQGLAENKMKLTKQQLKHIIKEEIESLLEQEQDSVESMIYRFMENGAEITDLNATDWIQPAVDPRTASIERDGKQIARIINDAFVTKEINRDRNDKPGRLDGGATLQKTEDGMPYVVFNVLGSRDVSGTKYRVVDNPNGGITIKVEKAPERMKYNEALEQIIKEEIEGLLDEIELDEKRKKKRKGKMPKKFSVKSGDKSKSGGLTAKGVKRYRRANPGSKLKTAVTKDPKKLKKGGKAAKRRLSFCRRMRGMKKKLTSKKTARDPDSRINKALRKWNC